MHKLKWNAVYLFYNSAHGITNTRKSRNTCYAFFSLLDRMAPCSILMWILSHLAHSKHQLVLNLPQNDMWYYGYEYVYNNFDRGNSVLLSSLCSCFKLIFWWCLSEFYNVSVRQFTNRFYSVLNLASHSMHFFKKSDLISVMIYKYAVLYIYIHDPVTVYK